MLTIITGVSGSGKTEQVCREIRDNMASRSGMVLLTPEQQSHRMERHLSAVCGDKLSLHAEVLSFTRMYVRAAVEAGGLADPLPDGGGRLLLMALAQQQTGDSLRRFGSRSRRMDFLPQLLQTAEELRAAGVSVQDLQSAASDSGGAMREKLKDMALLLGAYESVTHAQLGDSRDAIARLRDCIEATTVGSGGVWADGFTDFTALELQVLDRLLRRGTDVTVTLTLGDSAGEERFSVTEGCYQALQQLALRRGVEVKLCHLPDPPETPLHYYAENLFRWQAPSLPADAPVPVELYRMDSFAGECRLAAGRIRALLRQDDSLCYRDIAIAVPDFGSRRSALLTVLGEYGLPYYEEETQPLADKGAAVFLLAALRTVTEGWRQHDLFRALKTGFGGLSPEETDILENYCLTWDLQGESVWRRERDWELNPNGFDREPENCKAVLETLNGLRRRVAALLGPLRDALKEPQPVREQLMALWRFLETAKLAETLLETAGKREAAGNLSGARDCLSLWNGLTEAMNQMDTVLGKTTLSGEDFCRMLELLLRQQSLGGIPAAMDALSIGSPARLRGKKPRVLLVLGADEQSLPEKHGSTGLFSRQERQSLYELGVRLSAGKDDELCRPLLDTYLLLAEPQERLILSYAAGEDKQPGLPLLRAETLLHLRFLTEAELQGKQLTEAESPCLRLAMLGQGAWALAAQAVLWEEAQRLRALAAVCRGSLSPETVKKLYGSMSLTASRAEIFYRCAQFYFLEYGLNAKERKQALFDAPQTGTFTHYLLEQVFRQVAAGEGFHAVSEERLIALSEQAAAQFASERFRPGQMENPRFRYLFQRLLLTSELTVLDVAEELAAGDFVPLDFELTFGGDGTLPPVRVGSVQLRGTVDRVDGWQQGDELYLCVGDYKTGHKEFKKSDVWHGIGIQMLLYLHMLEVEGQAYYGKKIIPAGVLYTPAREVTVSLPRSSTEEKIRAEREKGLRRSGILLREQNVLQAREHGLTPRFSPVKYDKEGKPSGGTVTREELQRLIQTALRRVEHMSCALRQGVIRPDPLFTNKTQGPCNYCPGHDFCGFDPTRELTRTAYSMKDEEFWEKVKKEEENG